MFSFYKLCLKRFGLIFGHAIFLAVFGYVSGIILLYLTGGSDYVSFQPLIVWKNMMTQLSYYGANKDELGSDFILKLFGSLVAPFVIGLCIRMIFRVLSFPFRQMKKRRDAKKPRPLTSEERLANLETKLQNIEERRKELEAEKEKESTSPEPVESPSEEPSPTAAPHNQETDDSVIIMPPPDQSSQSHPPSVDKAFLSQKEPVQSTENHSEKKEN